MLGVCVGIDAFFSALVVGPSRMTGYALSHSAEVTHPFIQPLGLGLERYSGSNNSKFILVQVLHTPHVSIPA